MRRAPGARRDRDAPLRVDRPRAPAGRGRRVHGVAPSSRRECVDRLHLAVAPLVIELRAVA
jgi:hypothetical protein